MEALTKHQLRAAAVLAKRRQGAGNSEVGLTADFFRYQADPIGFGQDILKEEYTDDVKRVMESVRDYPVTIARSANGVGKSHGAARIAVWFYKCFPGAQVYTTAAPPENNLRRILWGEIGSIVAKHPQVFRKDRIQASLHIGSGPQTFIEGVAIPSSGTPEQREAKFSGKHAPNLLFIVDEGDAVPMEVYKGIESCMSGGNAHLLIMFNPRMSSGHVFNMEIQKQANVVELSAFEHPNVTTGRDIFPGAVSRDKTIRRINEWSRPLLEGEKPDSECYEVPGYLVGKTGMGLDGTQFSPLPAGFRKISNPSFSYMVLGQYPAQSEQQLISRAWVDAAVSRWMAYVAQNGEKYPTDNIVMGLDVAEFGNDFTVAILRSGNYIAKPLRWKNMDPDATAIRAVQISNEQLAKGARVDGTGVGAGVAPRMTRLGVKSASVKVGSKPTKKADDAEFLQLRDQIWWNCREWLRKDMAMLPPDEELIQELCVPQYEIRNGKIKVTDKDTMRELLGRSPDKADALCLALADEIQTATLRPSPLSDYRG